MLNNPSQNFSTIEKREPVNTWINDEATLEDIQVIPDGDQVAALFVGDDSKSHLCVNGTVWTHSFNRVWYPRFTPKNSLTALAQDDDGWTLIVDDSPWDTRFDYAWDTRFNDNGNHIALKYQVQGEYGMAVDGMSWDTGYSGIAQGVLSQDGLKSAAVVQLKAISEGDIFTFQEGIFTAAINGNAWKRAFVNVWDPCFSRDGNHLAASVRLNLYDYSVAVDGILWPDTFDCVWNPCFHPENQDVVAPVRAKQAWTMAKNGEIFWKNRFFQVWHPQFNQDGSYLAAIVAPKFGTWSIAVNDKIWKLDGFDAIANMTFSPDGSRIAAIAIKKGKQTLVYDGKACDRYCERIWPPVFSHDSRHIAAKIQIKDRYTVILNGRVWDKHYDRVWDPVFDPRDKTLIIRVMDNGVYLKHRVPLSMV